ncbi:dipeptidase E [Catenulispora sp. GP43]|uniref:Type 1 glutamine amidotransferase-like domain-containing protein n=1 Tax=Catenulispora sp. GP43 TaxID=3156263 RepID=UPI003514A2F8
MGGSVFLSGGGGVEDTAPLDSAFASALGSGPLWYWPMAIDPAETAYSDCLDWLTGVLGPLGVTDIDIWDGAGHGLARRFADYRGVYIGGGNTFRLLDVVRRSGMGPALQAFIDDGGAVYGTSAGAALLGADISTIAHLDPDPYGTTDTRGLDRIAGYAAFVHHRTADAPQVQDWVHRNQKPVIALHERSGAVVTDGRLTSVGFEPVQIFGVVRSPLNVQPGESIELPG